MAPAISQVRRGTTAQWVSPTQGPLRAGEIGLDTTTKVVKIGDGATAFATLPAIDGTTFGPTTLTANATLTTTQETVACDPTTAAFTVTLPTAVGVAGKRYTVKKLASTNTVTLATTAVQTIDGLTTYIMPAAYTVATVVSDGANWLVAAATIPPTVAAVADTVPRRDAAGHLLVPLTPTATGHAASKSYADGIAGVAPASETVAGKVELGTSAEMTTGTDLTRVPSLGVLSTWATGKFAAKAQSIYKELTTDVVVADGTALVDIGDLVHGLLLGEKWFVEGLIQYIAHFECGAKFSLAPPGTYLAGSRMSGMMRGHLFGPGGVIGVAANQIYDPQPIRLDANMSHNVKSFGGTTGDAVTAPGNLRTVDISQVNVTAGVAGDLRLRVARAFSPTTARLVTVLAGSWMTYVQRP